MTDAELLQLTSAVVDAMRSRNPTSHAADVVDTLRRRFADRGTKLDGLRIHLEHLNAELVRLGRDAAHGESCPICAGPVEQSGTGRPRLYCSTRCKRRASRMVRKGP